MTNGQTVELVADRPPVRAQFQLDQLSYGDLRRLQALDATTPAGQAVLDAVLEKAVVGGLDAIPILEVRATVVALMADIAEAMSGKNDSAAPS